MSADKGAAPRRSAHTLERFAHNARIAFFSMEIALRSEMHTYSGGLGVLAGDTARSCADLNLPVVFVSLISRAGYLRQEIDKAGRQLASDDPWDPSLWATPLTAMVATVLEGRTVWIRPWLYELTCPLGHSVAIIFLDTDLNENAEQDRTITHHLYGGDETYRLKQEAVLGIGGVRILQALGLEIERYHMNEGHAALLTMELLQRYPRPEHAELAHGPRYQTDRVLERCIFTTHTPVEAGHDKFSYATVANVLGDLVDIEELKHYAGAGACNMTRLALNLSSYVNGVAGRHAQTTQRIFPGYDVRAITNGIHVPSWLHPSFRRLFDAAFPQWSHEPEVLSRADQLRDEEIWNAHCEAKAELLALIRERTGVSMRPDLPLIGFARRMTAYKRPSLLLEDTARLRTIAENEPFQVVWAGKAHPRDSEGMRLIEDIHRNIKLLAPQIPMAFLANYDLDLAHRMTAGVDIWLNTPLPPLEASGTSGMKAAINGALNLSILDGWWLEGWVEGVTGWAIGTDDFASPSSTHASELYRKLEEKVLPAYARDRARWIWMMKESISKTGSYFNSQRMMRRYATEAYLR